MSERVGRNPDPYKWTAVAFTGLMALTLPANFALILATQQRQGAILTV